MQKKILLLGSGELGKELVIALQRLGQYVIAVDNYAGAPAMQVAHEFEVIDMLDGNVLDEVVAKHKPDLIVPEIEAIRTERFYEYEKQGKTNFHKGPLSLSYLLKNEIQNHFDFRQPEQLLPKFPKCFFVHQPAMKPEEIFFSDAGVCGHQCFCCRL